MVRVKNALLYFTAGCFLLIVSWCAVSEQCAAKEASPDVFEQNKRLGRGINLGNALDAPNEGEWGVTLKEEYFKIIKEAGFDSVRVPIRWSNHALKEPPYTIDSAFFNRVDWAIKNAIRNDLYVMINVHHYFELMEDPNAHSKRFLALWKQIAERYKDYPDSVMFEPLNEPCKALTAGMWNELLKKALAVIRESNPNRTVVVNPAEYNAFDMLDKLTIPEEDRNIIVSFHYYSPMEFTHQNAEWVEGSKQWAGTRWTGTDEQKKAITDAFDKAAAWGKKHNRPINLGEFGVYKDADKDDRARWTAFVAKSAIEHGFSYHYWEFCHECFGAYDQQTNQWKAHLLNALIPPGKL
jgi:endoglucanase